jgi:hypothetical protein
MAREQKPDRSSVSSWQTSSSSRTADLKIAQLSASDGVELDVGTAALDSGMLEMPIPTRR